MKNREEMKQYIYEALNKCCRVCNRFLIEDIRLYEDNSMTRTGLYCPTCRMNDVREMEPYQIWMDRARHILCSTERKFIRTVEDNELIKKHAVSAYWFNIGRKIYAEPDTISEKSLKEFSDKHKTPENILVYLPNNHLQRLYFFVPKNAIA